MYVSPYEYARADLGLSEIQGSLHNDRILEMFRAVGHGWVKDDETAWCAAAMGYWLGRAGHQHTGRLDAQSYKDYGIPIKLSEARPGDIVVWRRGPPGNWQGHVGFYVRQVGDYIETLGGNQKDKVGVNRYPINSDRYTLIAVRRIPRPQPVDVENRQTSIDDLLDFIGKLESNGDYDAIVWAVSEHRYPNRPISKMTIGQVLDWQDSIDRFQNSEAVGKYQILEDTLREIYHPAGLTKNHKFDERTQDKLARYLLERRGLDRYLRGEISAERFANNLAMEWASLPVVSDVKRGDRLILRGQSYYSGVAGNKALARAAEFESLVEGLSKRKESKPVGPTSPPSGGGFDRANRLKRLLARIFAKFK